VHGLQGSAHRGNQLLSRVDDPFFAGVRNVNSRIVSPEQFQHHISFDGPHSFETIEYVIERIQDRIEQRLRTSRENKFCRVVSTGVDELEINGKERKSTSIYNLNTFV